ncbi:MULTISPECIES: 3-isopropylmalate dehydrogenase [Robiginitalea]|uniref:3-isopropylmalate dehydrogenase n=1 Tax=Robiginitalea biformata (strain ATCC BAA-864 / DSM 15991 / KCTC 12146 / HTCC2501) TaxID=313596 RepID=A4CLQ8_ROBBH|nr:MULTISPECIES: 3-isopropylmalate dehydrogenase [Robiginitalea]EAR15807.1 3-isopropylmalate dehydrogenase [Robiginitalea biformata HTCC2501]MDC6354231.1 3-isopropylmalate dehydrogenase [Robiginitalea sp. PM2]MDC6374498.1 3-isopropylmalate dehydrogenase [Robiginitalea sp. SP8]
MKLKIALLPGDGIGPEVAAQAVACLQAVEEAFGHQFEFTKAPVGAIAIDQTGNPLPDDTLELCKQSDAVLFGAIGDPKYDNDPESKVRPEQGLLRLRKELGLFSNIRPVKVFPTLIDKSPLRKERIENTDFVIYRELTGGIYFGEKFLSEDGNTASDLCIYSEEEISRIAHLAFKAAKGRRKKLTLVDKANVLESSRLWRRVVTRIGESYPDVELHYLFVDNAAMQMILNPSQFDVILTENMFGDILSDEGSVIGGSIGLLPSASVGESSAMFEPIHGSYPQATGKNIANPIASILSAAMLLDHFGLDEEAAAVVRSVNKALKKGMVTPDLDPKSKHGTDDVGQFIAGHISDSDDFKGLNQENIGLGKSTII